jgi:hypothetical protein
MKLLSAVLVLALTCPLHAEVKRVKQLEGVKGIEYIDTAEVFKKRKVAAVPIHELVSSNPPMSGTAYRVRVVKWKPSGRIQAIWTYQLKRKDGNYEFQRLYSSQTKIDVMPGDSVLYYTNP